MQVTINEKGGHEHEKEKDAYMGRFGEEKGEGEKIWLHYNLKE